MFSVPNGYPFTPAVSTIPATGVNYLWAQFPNAWDIVNGGTYTPATKTILGGAIGLRCNFTAVGLEIANTGGLHVLSGSYAYIDNGGILEVSVGGLENIKGESHVKNGGALVVESGGSATWQGGSAATWNNTATLTMAAGSTLDVNGTCTLDGSTTRTGSMTLSGNGAWTALRRTDKGSVGAATTIDITADVYRFIDPSAPCTCTITRPTGQPAGIVLRAYSVGVITNNITFENNGAGIARIVAGAGIRQTVDFLWDGTDWETMLAAGGATAL